MQFTFFFFLFQFPFLWLLYVCIHSMFGFKVNYSHSSAFIIVVILLYDTYLDSLNAVIHMFKGTVTHFISLHTFSSSSHHRHIFHL